MYFFFFERETSRKERERDIGKARRRSVTDARQFWHNEIQRKACRKRIKKWSATTSVRTVYYRAQRSEQWDVLRAAFHGRRGAGGGGMTSRMGSGDVSRLVRVDRCGARRLSNVLQWSRSTIKVPSNEHAASQRLFYTYNAATARI